MAFVLTPHVVPLNGYDVVREVLTAGLIAMVES